MMILMDGHSLTARDNFAAEGLGLQLSERQSTATMTVSDAAPVLSVDDWIQADDGPGTGIVWRVKAIDTQYNTRTRTVTLEHVINTLKDRIMFGEVKTQDISGGNTATAEETVEYILARQSDWELGDFDYSVSNPYSFNGDDLFSALETVSSSLEDCIWEYDFSDYPFTIHIRQMSSTVCSEMRTDRNIRTLKKTIDRSRMYTRFYPIGKNNLHIDGDYVSKNENLYGTVSKTETDQTLDTKDKLRDWALERLNRHCEPAVTVTISGLELVELTGEALDSFTIGRMCRVPLPEFSTTITERVTKLSYSDVIRDPMSVTVTLANELQDVAKILRDQASSGGRSARAGAKQDEEDHAWFVDTEDHVSMVAEAVAGKDESGNPDWSRVSELTVDGNGIDARVVHAEGEIVDAWSAIHMTESSITLEVSAAKSELHSSIIQTASNIKATIEDAEDGLYSYINATASGIYQRMVNKSNQVWIQDTDPHSEAGGGHEARAGDIWVQSTHQGTWDGADGFDWEHDEQYDWYAIQGAKVWGWQNDQWELVSDQQQVVSYSDVVDTAEHYVNIKIAGIVNDQGLLDVYMAKLEETATEIRSDIYRADSALYSYIDQTASAINIGVGSRPTTVRQTEQPTTIDGREPRDNDIWIQTQNQENWDAAIDYNWGDDSEILWNELRSDSVLVYTDGEWVKAVDGTVIAEDTDIQVESNHISLLARNIDTLDGYARANFAELRVEATRIRSTVQDRTNELGSEIVQTASMIRAEVHASQSTIYSVITQTASAIRLEVANVQSAMGSSITQTASQIRAEVHAADSRLSSSITQTASIIRLEVKNAISGVKSTITQTASQIRSEVDAAKSGLYSSITQTASAIRTEVRNAVSGVYSNITQTASQIRSEVNAAKSNLYSSITQTASAIRAEVADVESGLESSIDVQKNRISLVVSGTGSNASIKAASIVTSINNAGSSVAISANHVTISGTTTINDILGITDQRVYIKSNARINGDAMMESITLRDGSDSLTVNESTLKGMVKSFSVSGNTLTLTPFYGDPVNFSKATALSGAWSGSNHTVTASPQGNTYSIGFGSYGAHNLDLEITTNGNPSVSAANIISVPIKLSSLNSGQTAPTSRYTKNLAVAVSSILQAKTGDNKITANGTYTPDSGYLGFSSVEVSMPTYSSRTLRCTDIQQTYPGSSNSYYYFRLEGNYGFSKNTNYTMYRTSW